MNKTIQIFFFFIIIIFNTSCQSVKNLVKEENLNLYVGTATNLASEGIYVFSFNQQTGNFQQKHKETNILNPSFLSLSSNHDFLYTVFKIEGQKESGVRAYKIEKESGSLKLINQQSTLGRGACYVSVDKENQHLLVAHYSSGSVSIFPTQGDGSIGIPTKVMQHKGASVHPERQKGPHAHFVKQGIGDFVYAADLGIDKIMLYTIDQDQLSPANPGNLDLTPGAGPRHISFHPNQQYLYVMNELGGSVTVFKYDKKTNAFTTQQTISSLPPDFEGFNKSADIHVHPSGKFLYASNRGVYESIAVFKIDPSTGRLTLVELEKEAIIWPRNFAISPNGKFLLVANLNDDSISVFTIDTTTGVLNFTGNKMVVPKPLCVKFGGGQ